MVINASFVTQVSSYFIKLPTTLNNGDIVYIQVTAVGSQQLAIMGGATIQENMYLSSGFWAGYAYVDTPTTYKLTFYAPSSNNPMVAIRLQLTLGKLKPFHLFLSVQT